MLLSVIVPVHNAEKTLQRCIDSLMNQGLSEETLEILCVDDGSVDCSLSILESYAASHSCMKVFSQVNKGAGEARNVGLKYATGEVVTFCDADDYLIPGGLGYLLDNFWTENLDVLCHGSTTLDAKKLKYWQELHDVRGEIVCEGTGRDVFERDPKYFVWNMLVRRSFLDRLKLRFLPLTMSEDSCFMLELMMQATYAVDVSSNIYRYTVNEQQVTSKREPELMRQCIDGYLTYMKRLKVYGQTKVLALMRRPFYSRLFSAAFSEDEYHKLILQVNDVAIWMPPYWLYARMSWLFRVLIIPYVLPRFGRG